MMCTRFALLCVALGTSFAPAAPVLRAVRPAQTDPQITTDLESHLVAIDPGTTPRSVLYVHLVGSCGAPLNNIRIVRHAASLGLHVVSLSYPNCPSVTDLAAGSSDPDVHEQIRLERLYGVDASPLVDVTRPNCVENRLVRLLQYLGARFPDESWGEYLEDELPRWSAIVIGGHSQGSGHAALVAKDHAVGGCLMLGGPGDGFAGGKLAPWLLRSGITPAERHVGFTHRFDAVFARAASSYGALGMDGLGPMITVDAFEPPYRDSHEFTSTAPPGTPGEFHGCVVVDAHLVILPEGTALYEPVWTQMFEAVLRDPTENLGDMNCDGMITVSDITGFIQSLVDPSAYSAQFPSCSPLRADLDGDGGVGLSDIGPFVMRLTGSR